VPIELVREAVFLGVGRFRSTVEVSWPSGRFVVSTADMDVSRRTFVSGPYGLDRLLRAAELVERETGRAIAGREVLEVGANIGTTTVPLLTVLGASRVHAFEPVPRNLALLERNVALNGLGEAVTVHASAISERPGTVSLTLPDRFWGSSRVSTGQPGPVHTARCRTIDELIAQRTIDPERLALVWIDVEGHEASVLRGATTLPPTPLVLEHDRDQHGDITELHRLLGTAVLYDLASGERTDTERLGREPAKPTDLLVLPQRCIVTRSRPARKAGGGQ